MKKITRNAMAFALCATSLAVAHAWPTKSVTIVVPFPAGGTTDVIARALSNRLSAAIGQPVIVENRAGAGATIGAAYVAKAQDGGHTLLMGAVHHTVATSAYKSLSYSFERDFAPITNVALVPNVMTVSATSPYKTVREFVTAARAKPEGIAYGSNGNGTAQHMIGTQFQMETNADLLHVPFNGSGPLTTALLGGHVQVSFDTATPVLPHIREGKLRALAVTTAKRSSALPDVPTLQEAGVSNIAIGTWFGLLAPASAPKEVVVKLSAEVTKIIKSPEFIKQMNDIGAEPVGNTSEEFARQIREETAKFAQLFKSGRIKLD
jgi:tripartite-type tricarboxylate transporter receptor subunit TctC